MLNILYNDSYSNLSLVFNPDTEVVMIIDDDLEKHYEKNYSLEPVEAVNLLKAWEQAIDKYFGLSDDLNEKKRAWRENMATKSVDAFKNYLMQSKARCLPDYEKTVKDFIRLLIYNTCERLDRVDFYDDESYEVDQIIDYVYAWYSHVHNVALAPLVETVLHFELEEGMMILNADVFMREMDDYLRTNF